MLNITNTLVALDFIAKYNTKWYRNLGVIPG